MRAKTILSPISIFLVIVMLLILAPASVMADTSTLNPTADGYSVNLTPRPPGSARWEVSSSDDGDTSYVQANGDWTTDFYQMGDMSLTGTINSVTVYIKAKAENETILKAGARTVIRTHDTDYNGDEKTLTTSYSDYSQVYTTNPYTGAAWTWSEINDLQAGVSLRRSNTTGAPNSSSCTRVWVVVDYTDSYVFAGWRPPVSLDGPPDGWKSGSMMPVKFLVEDSEGNPVTSGVSVTVQIGESDAVAAVWDPDEDFPGQWKAEVMLAGDGWQDVIITGNITGITPLQINVKP